MSAGHLGGIDESCPLGQRNSPRSGSAVAGTVVSTVPEFTLPPTFPNGGVLMHDAQTTAIARAQMASSGSREHLC
jgi:hypothetical protein